MTLKKRFSILFSSLFSVLVGLVMLVIYYLFSEYRQQEFKERLLHQAENTVKLLLEVKEVDYQTLKIIDRNSINKLFNEKTLVFDASRKLIYSSLDDAVINWSNRDLDQIKARGVTYQRSREYDVLGLYYQYAGKDYYVLVSAEDTYGHTKIVYLRYLLVIAFLASTSLIWILSFYVSKKSLAPLDHFKDEIQEITDRNLNKRLPAYRSNDEINGLSHSFNQMMDRIDKAYQKQKAFTGNASHELRTPLARVLIQLENIGKSSALPPTIKQSLFDAIGDLSDLSEIVTSLLLLSEIENRDTGLKKVRLDEIIFNAAAAVYRNQAGLKFQFEIEPGRGENIDLDIDADETLLQIAFYNLIRNAFTYSDDGTVICTVRQDDAAKIVSIINRGPAPSPDEIESLFNTFTRGSNAVSKTGSGIGLSIVKRIMQYHHAGIRFEVPESNVNRVIVSLPGV
ncbi:ATP-binding protein [Pedobacter sp. SYP-B3415]|uniref:sensor histidine kinase n=1 Tax=Pedobacter sp. SYP-B3415 TaxID=2496641 RepID=UPI00101C9A6E|nr:ATP-binding protein [Pedobacter sp. SYP-B3415]